MARLIEPEGIANYAAAIGGRAEVVGAYEGQLTTDALPGLQPTGDLEQGLRLDPDWFGGPTAVWYQDISDVISAVYFSRADEAVRIHEELTGIQQDLTDFVAEAERNEDEAVFEINHASEPE